MTSNIINKKSVFENSIVNLKSFILLMKPRVMSLVIFTCAVGLLTAPENVTFYNSTSVVTIIKLDKKKKKFYNFVSDFFFP